jgi:NACalpha-BTF3-like transcription factor
MDVQKKRYGSLDQVDLDEDDVEFVVSQVISSVSPAAKNDLT